jgi:CO/xanthine dehydrogenase Mo-binding subunit
VPVDKVVVHTTLLGGGFGRRGEADFVTDAVEVAKAMKGTPVKTMWTREDDITHGFYRPATTTSSAPRSTPTARQPRGPRAWSAPAS